MNSYCPQCGTFLDEINDEEHDRDGFHVWLSEFMCPNCDYVYSGRQDEEEPVLKND